MRSSVTTALGIDVTEAEISVVLLGKADDGFRVLHAMRAPVPEGAIEHGRIVGPSAVLGALKTLRERHKTRTRRVALSLPIPGTLTRVIPLEELDPQQIARFVQDEVRQYASFSGRATVSDFRVLVPATPGTAGKLLVSAADHEGAATLVSTCRNAGMPSTTVESGVTACLRAFTEIRTSGAGDWTLLALRKDGTLTLCVLRKAILDYIRTKTIPTVDTGPQDVHEWVADECNAVVEFYRLEGVAASGHWDVVVIDDTDGGFSEEDQGAISKRLSVDDVKFWTRAQWLAGLAIDGHMDEELSIAGVGLAVGLLRQDDHGSSVNLLPQEERRALAARRNMLLAANALAMLVLAVVLISGGFSWMAQRANRNTADLKQAALERGDRPLPLAVNALTSLEQHTSAMSAEMNCLRHVSESRVDLDWGCLLADIRDAVPNALHITELSLGEGPAIQVEGVSESYEGVDTFVEMLNRSDHIRHAALVRKARSTAEANVRYVVKCSLIARKIR
jgi:Tfp pilus assembly protein PilN